MAGQIVHFAGLSDRDGKAASPLPKLGAGDRLELHVALAWLSQYGMTRSSF